MDRIFTGLTIQSPDLYHTVGQTLVKPVSLLLGRSYKIENGVHQLPCISITKRVLVAALAILLLPLTLISIALGTAALYLSSSHKKAYNLLKETEIQVLWRDGLPEIRTQRLVLRPIQTSDLKFYQELFNNKIAMAKYAGGVRDVTNRFNGWLDRWKEHSFSALAVVDKADGKAIGHVISGHGDYEGDFSNGWSEMAVVIDPAYWNSNFKGDGGSAGMDHIGSEVVRASLAYARSLSERSIPVPSDVSPEQRSEVEKELSTQENLKAHRNDTGQIDWVYLPFTELRATAHKENTASYKILEQVFQKENQAEKKQKSPERDLFVINL